MRLSEWRYRPRHVNPRIQDTWLYTIDAPVIPGDVLEVNTELGRDYMVVDKISYVAGKDDCGRFKKVCANTTCTIGEFVEFREVESYMA